ncbi:MAG: DNA integrity scanning protein DisA nucleotide-binding domain protein [Planctomycetes bacterium]|nr:DNA integrity scanning protein DisA nucleotide-binding domain protein [Planctomycetota bacterium]
MPAIDRKYSKSIIEAACRVAKAVKARALLAYVDAVDDLEQLQACVKPPTELICVIRDRKDRLRLPDAKVKSLLVPGFNLTRMGQIKMAALMAFTQQWLTRDDVFVFLTGVAGQRLDTMMVMEVGLEYELFHSVDQPKLTEHIRRVVFQRALNLALELAHEGREGKPVGTVFVIGDYREVRKHCHQSIINPFHGYPEKQRNILDEGMKETIKEFSSIDGAFIIKGTGVIMSAGTTLRSTIPGDKLPQGLGARHAAAQGITAVTRSIALTISESTGMVRIWRRGKLITEIEKAPPSPVAMGTPRPLPPSDPVNS